MSRVSPPPPPAPPGSTAGATTWLPGGRGTSGVCVCLVDQSCPTLCHPLCYSPPGSSVHGILRQEHWSGLPCVPALGTWICSQPGYAGGESMALSWVWGRDPGPAVPYCLVTDHEVAVGWAHPISASVAARLSLGSQDANLVPCSARPCHPAMGAMTACGQIDGVQ